MLIFYGLINVGAFFGIATTYAEKYVGYWLAFLLPTILYLSLPILLALQYKKTIKMPPNGSELNNVFAICGMAIKNKKGNFFSKQFFDDVKPSSLAAKGITTFRGKPISWNDKLVEDVKRTFAACSIFLYFPIYNINDGGVGGIATSQGSTMLTKGAPNDLLSNFNPLTIIISIPILSHILYPLLARYHIKFGRISRITLGFSLAAVSAIPGAIIQWKIYQSSPCGYYATGCTVGSGVAPLSIWLQLPNVMLGALSECFANVTAYELAYARSPKHMKALVMSLFLFTNALSSALGEILTPAIVDPHLIWVWAGPGLALAAQTIVFWFRYRHLDDDEFMTYEQEETIENERRASMASTTAGQDDNKKQLNIPEVVPEVQTPAPDSGAMEKELK